MKILNKKTHLLNIFLVLNFSINSTYAGTLTVDFENYDEFGEVLAKGDFNNDGKISLVVGSPGKMIRPNDNPNSFIRGAGSITVISNHMSAFRDKRGITFSQLGNIEGSPEEGDRFGSSLAVGDFNADGYDDLAIGVPGERLKNWQGDNVEGVGAVNIIYGSSSGLNPDNNQFFSGVRYYKAGFGTALTAGNFNGDLFDDLAIGIPGYGGGRVQIHNGGYSGLSKYTFQSWGQNSRGIKGTEESEDQFGFSLASGDFNDDNYDDLAIGAPGEGVGNIKRAGAVNILYGSPQSITANNNQIWDQNKYGIPGASETDDAFGYSLATGRLNGDGYDDLVIGVPQEDIGTIKSAGAINILYGKSFNAGLTSEGSQIWSQNSDQILGESEEYDLFGSALTTADFNNDRFDEIVIGVPGEIVTKDEGCFLWDWCFNPNSPDEGAVNVLFGGLYGVVKANNQIWHQNSNNIEGVSDAFDRFGSSLVTGDFNYDGQIDLAIGSPLEDRKGAVNTILSFSNGLTDHHNNIIMEKDITFH